MTCPIFPAIFGKENSLKTIAKLTGLEQQRQQNRLNRMDMVCSTWWGTFGSGRMTPIKSSL